MAGEMAPRQTEEPDSRERLHRFLARCGVGSRRHCEEMITAGRVRVNGEVIRQLGSTVDPARDRVELDGRPLRPAAPVYWLLNKPPGYLCTVADPQGRPTVMDFLPAPVRVFPVGRLDYDAGGLVLMTNDGELAYRLTHPRFEVAKIYRVLVRGTPSAGGMQRLRKGVIIDGRRTARAEVRLIGRDGRDTWLEIAVHEGRHHQVKLMCEAVGHPVRRLIRVGLGPLRLEDLRPGQLRPLTPQEVAALRACTTTGRARGTASSPHQGTGREEGRDEQRISRRQERGERPWPRRWW